MYLNSVWLWNYVCICTFLHGGIAIFGGFPSFLLDATGPAAPAIGRSSATILLQSHQKWLQKDRLPPPEKKHIFSDFQIKKQQLFSDFQIQKTNMFLPNDHLLHLFGQCTGRQTRGFKDLERDASGRVMGCPKKNCRKVQWWNFPLYFVDFGFRL